MLAHQGLARHVARRFAGASPQIRQDLEQAALLGLVKAAKRFDPSRGVAFTSFAMPTIAGELRRFHRDTRWHAHVPRRVQERYLEVRAFEQRHVSRHGRRPSAVETAEALGCTAEDVVDCRLAAASMDPVPLSRTAGGSDEDDELQVEQRLGRDDPGYRRAELREELERAMSHLTPLARTAVRLRLEGELPLADVARRLHVSPSRAARLLDESVATLRALLEPRDPLSGSPPEAA